MTDQSEQLQNQATIPAPPLPEVSSKPASKLSRSLLSLGLTLTCILAGYGFYQMNHRDGLNAVFFTVGLSGIMLSVLRRRKTP